jgi:hypothetical protein
MMIIFVSVVLLTQMIFWAIMTASTKNDTTDGAEETFWLSLTLFSLNLIAFSGLVIYYT